MKEYKHFVANVIVAFDLGREVDTYKVYEQWVANEKFKRFNIFSVDDYSNLKGLVIRPIDAERKVTIRLHRTGKGMVVGARSEEEALTHLDNFVKELG